MSESLRLRLSLDSDQFQADCALLAQTAERSQRLLERLLGFGDLSSQVRCVQVEGPAAAGALHARFRLELADGLADLVRAVRAGEFDRG